MRPFLFILFNCFLHGSVLADSLEKFSYSETWLRALHYKKSTFGNFYSLLSEKFFLHPLGSQFPLKEAKLTLKELERNSTNVCKFPYRMKLLADFLGRPIDWSRCTKLNKWRKILKADKISFVLASPYNGDVESIFGHLFIRFIREDRSVEKEKVLHFIGVYPKGETVGPKIIKGVTGMYRGDYRVYELINRISLYTYIERRTLYEYELNLSKKQIDALVDHAWELEYSGEINYSFAGGNCTTYMLIAFEGIITNFPQGNSIIWNYDTPIGGVSKLYQSGLISGLRVWPAMSGKNSASWMPMFDRKAKRSSDEKLRFLKNDPEGEKIFQKEKSKPIEVPKDDTLPHLWPSYRQLELSYDMYGVKSQEEAKKNHTKQGVSVNTGYLFQEWNRSYMMQGITELEFLRFHYRTYAPTTFKWLKTLKIEKGLFPSWGFDFVNGYQNVKLGFALPFRSTAFYALYEKRFPGKFESTDIQSLNFKGWIDRFKVSAHYRQNPGQWKRLQLHLGLRLDQKKRILFKFDKPMVESSCKDCRLEFESSPGDRNWISTQRVSFGLHLSF